MVDFFKKPLILLTFFYVLFRLPQLTSLPIINDESIYLDWGFRSTHSPGQLYYSLYDAKQPLMIWLFGIFESIFPDPLLAGRLVSVIFGLVTMYGIYKLTSLVFNKKYAILSSFLYIVIPIFTLFDRQALMESGIATVGVWACYFLLKILREKSTKFSFLLGITLGLGFFIKTTSLLFLMSSILILASKYIQSRDKVTLKFIGIIIASFITSTILLLLNPMFWETFSSNSRYVYSLSEILKFPINAWMHNASALLEISFIYLTPFVLICAIGGLYLLIMNKKYSLSLFFLIPIFMQVLTVRIPSQRYLVALLPLACIFAVYFLLKIFKQKNYYTLLLFSFLTIIPLAYSLLQIYSPYTYFSYSKKVTRFSDSSIVENHLSGYGIIETIDFLKEKAKTKKIIASYAENTGNPESAIIVYLQNNKEIPHAYIERRYFGDVINGKECVVLKSGHEVYFISRNEQQAGLEQILEKIKTIKKPNGTDSIGIYRMKNTCKNPLEVDLVLNE